MSSNSNLSQTTPLEASIDLVQIRWQQIRETEFHQKIQQENLDLKKEIRKLEKDLKDLAARPTVAPSTNTVSARTAAAINRMLAEFRLESDRDLQDVRLSVTENMTAILAMQATFFQCNKRLQGLFEESETKVMQYRRDKKELQQTILELKREISDFNVLHANDLNSMEARCERLTREKAEAEGKIKRLEEENERLQKELSISQSEREELRQSYQTTKETNDRLESEMKLLQSTTERLLTESSQTQQQLIQHYEGMIEQMAVDNQYLKNHIQDLEEQIARLSQSLIGNKSHFAKYVEVKTENIALQSKLNSILKQPNKASFNAGGGGGGALPVITNPEDVSSSRTRPSLIAQDLVELAALTRSSKQPSLVGKEKEMIPSLPLPKLTNARHSLDNGVPSQHNHHTTTTEKTIGSHSARDNPLSPRTTNNNNSNGGGGRSDSKRLGVTSAPGSSTHLVNSSSLQVVSSPRQEREHPHNHSASSASSGRTIEKKKSLRLLPASNTTTGTSYNRNDSESSSRHLSQNKLIV